MAEIPAGMEMMMRAMGMGPALDAVKQLVADGVVQKIAKFADNVEELNGRLERIERQLEAYTSSSNGGYGGSEEQRTPEGDTDLRRANGS